MIIFKELSRKMHRIFLYFCQNDTTMRGLNKVMLIGNMGRDPEVQAFDGGKKRASFTLATSEKYKDKNGVEQTLVEWHNIVVWGPQAETVEKYLKKGMPLFIEGRIKTREYTNKEGIQKRVTEIIADNFSMLGSRKQDDQAPYDDQMDAPKGNNNIVSDSSPADDLPF